jgi:hypothetical protein
MEPMYVCDITVPTSAVSGVYETLNARRGQVEGQDDRPGTPLTKVKVRLTHMLTRFLSCAFPDMYASARARLLTPSVAVLRCLL